MKIALFALNGSYSHTSLAIRCLRPRLETAGFDTVLIENSLRDRDNHILRRLYDADADIYAFSTYIWSFEKIMELSEKLKALRPDATMIFGGPEVSFETERFDGACHMDFVIRGEGEGVLCRLCESVREIGREATAEKYGKYIERKTFSLDRADENIMSDEGILYRRDDTNAALFYYESSRGCPYSCAYCLSCTSDGVRAKSVEQTLSDLEAFEEFKGQCKVVKFVDRTFNFDVKRANAIWRALLSDKFTLKYHFEVCVSLLNEESFEILSKFEKGKIQLEVGLQSTNDKTLAAVSRHLSAVDVLKATKRIAAMGNIDVYLDLIAGLPYEDAESFAKSFDDAYFASSRLQVGFLKLLPGTSLREKAEEYGYVYDKKPPYTVLKSKWLDYSEMENIHDVHELLERYAESGHFGSALDLVLPQVKSPFAFWSGFAQFIKYETKEKPLQKISQQDAYRLLSRYFKIISAKENFDFAAARTRLIADFEAAEHKRAVFGI